MDLTGEAHLAATPVSSPETELRRGRASARYRARERLGSGAFDGGAQPASIGGYGAARGSRKRRRRQLWRRPETREDDGVDSVAKLGRALHVRATGDVANKVTRTARHKRELGRDAELAGGSKLYALMAATTTGLGRPRGKLGKVAALTRKM